MRKMLCKSFFDTYKRPERFLVLLNLMGSQMITPRNFSCSRAKQQYGTGKRLLMIRWKWYCLRCFLIWCLGSKECSYSLENTPSNDIPYTTIQILNICVLFCSSWWKSPQGRSEFRRKWGQSWQLRSTSTLVEKKCVENQKYLGTSEVRFVTAGGSVRFFPVV